MLLSFIGTLDLDALAHGVAGAFGGMVAIGVFFPLEVFRTRLQAEDDGAGGAAALLLVRWLRTEGIKTLYQGFGAVLITVGCSNFVYFGVYSLLKNLFAESSFEGVVSALASASILRPLLLAALAGVVNVLITTPLWLVSTRIKVQQSRPHVPLSTSVTMRSRDFEQWDSWGRKVPLLRQQGDHQQHRVASSQNGGAGTRARPYKNLWDGLLRVCQEEGAATLWGGTVPSLILVSSPAIQWAVYEATRAQLAAQRSGCAPGSEAQGCHQPDGELLSPLDFFVLATVAKTVATVFTYPLQLAQTRLRNNSVGGAKAASSLGARPQRYAGTLDCLQKLYQAQGPRGWFRGIEAKMLQTVLTAAFHITCYEEVVRLFLHLLKAMRAPSRALMALP